MIDNANAKMRKADSTLRSSRAVPHPSTDRALRRLTSEVGRDPVHSTRYGRQRMLMQFDVKLRHLRLRTEGEKSLDSPFSTFGKMCRTGYLKCFVLREKQTRRIHTRGQVPRFRKLQHCVVLTLHEATQKNCLHFSICACHPCAGAMLIFSVSFQF